MDAIRYSFKKGDRVEVRFLNRLDGGPWAEVWHRGTFVASGGFFFHIQLDDPRSWQASSYHWDRVRPLGVLDLMAEA